MKLNLAKSAFKVGSEKFSGFMISERAIETYPEKVEAILNMPDPQSINDV